MRITTAGNFTGCHCTSEPVFQFCLTLKALCGDRITTRGEICDDGNLIGASSPCHKIYILQRAMGAPKRVQLNQGGSALFLDLVVEVN